MTPLGLFRKKEKETTDTTKEEQAAAKSKETTLLDELTNSNKELYEAMSRTLLLNPEANIKEGTDFHAEKGQQFENNQKPRNARIEYQVAGQIALYEGKLQQAQKFFKKAAEVEPDYEFKRTFEYFSKKENAERALSVAREFYKKTGKKA